MVQEANCLTGLISQPHTFCEGASGPCPVSRRPALTPPARLPHTAIIHAILHTFSSHN